MYKIFIVDDEVLVRTQIKMLIPWEKLQLSLAGEAANGKEAYESIRVNRPDIVLCDIEMPIMDGLQLCEVLHKEYPDIQFVALSNYEDYMYVRGILKLGAVDYLLKQQLSQSYISDAFSKAIERLKKDPKKDKVSQSRTPGHMEVLKKEFLINLLSGFYTEPEKIKHQMKVLEIPLSFYNLLPVVMTIKGYGELVEAHQFERINMLEFAVQNICNEIMTESYKGITFLASANVYVVLLSLDSFRSEQKWREHVQKVVMHIKRNLKKFLNVSVRFSAGSMCTTAEGLKDSFKEACVNLKQVFYTSEDSLFIQVSSATHNEMVAGLEASYEQRLWRNLALGERRLVTSALSEVFDNIYEKRLQQENVQMILNDMLSIISKYCKMEGLDFDHIYDKGIYPYDMLRRFETLSEIRDWFYKTFHNMLECSDALRECSDSPHIRKALQIINRRYREDISQQSVAREIGISSSYLSSQFKSNMRKGFNDYLSEFRLEKAKQLIRSGNHNFQEVIQECGFYNYNYFFKIFKKKVGMTPKEYACQTNLYDFEE